MGFRFSKSIKLFRGVRLNLSKGGISASIGRPGATINVGQRGVRATTGVPGSGLSYSTDLYRSGSKPDEAPTTPVTIQPNAALVADKTSRIGLLGRLLDTLGLRR